VVSTIENESLHERGYILATQLQGTPDVYDWEASSMVFIVDPDGDIVWWYPSRVGREAFSAMPCGNRRCM
jgi:hypothetical protein